MQLIIGFKRLKDVEFPQSLFGIIIRFPRKRKQQGLILKSENSFQWNLSKETGLNLNETSILFLEYFNSEYDSTRIINHIL